MSPRLYLVAAIVCIAVGFGDAFAPQASISKVTSSFQQHNIHYTNTISLRMSESEESTTSSVATIDEEEEEVPMDAATKLQMEKQKKADELRAQEVFMKRSTGIHKCSNCDWEYDPEKGDSFLIGGMIKPGTAFEDLPSNWRCPTCRASKDGFNEVVETIPGFEVNQGYGFGTNAMTSGQKNTLIWGSLGFFLFLFLGGYALS